MQKLHFEYVIRELRNGVIEKGHPFRCFTLATQGITNIHLRTVVLREVDTNLVLSCYTDARSQKIKHLKATPKASLLFYHPTKRFQISIKANVVLEEDSEILKSVWDTIPHSSKKDYTSIPAPGSVLKKTASSVIHAQSHHLAIIRMYPQIIEYVQLHKVQHIRNLYTKTSAGWAETRLVP